MPTSSRGAVLYAPGDLRVESVAAGDLVGDDLFVRVERCGVCGSDAGLLAGKIAASYPAIIGHEIVGVVEELGPGAAQHHGVQVGDRVVLEFPIRCGSCRHCLGGDYRLCDLGRGYGGPVSINVPPGLWGGMAERVYVSRYSMAHMVPPGVEPELALLACAVLGNGIRWTVTLGHATVGSSVIVLGAGPQGLACVIAAREAGAHSVVAVGRATSVHRLQVALSLGATAVARSDADDASAEIRAALGSAEADLVVDTTGSPDSLLLAVPLTRKGGRVVVAGQSGAAHQPIPLDQVVEREISVIGANSHDFRAVEPALALIASGRYPFASMITHTFPLSRARDAVNAIRDPALRAVKVVVDTTV
jgi:alcohol dehydrogenase